MTHDLGAAETGVRGYAASGHDQPMEVAHRDLMYVAATYLRSHPSYADDLSAWLAWTLPRGIDPTAADPDALAAFCAATEAGRGWVRSWRRTCRERLT
jgi:hypothetical protein